MNWFGGNIAEAVNLSKSKNSIFVVYVEGPDDLSKKITTLINHDSIKKYLESNHFVAIKIQSGSEAYMQFAQIYQLVPLPSLFFIGRNGTPLQVVTGVTNTVEELEEKILTVLKSTGVEVTNIGTIISSSSQNSEAAQSSSEDQSQGATGYTASQETPTSVSLPIVVEVICDGDVCETVPKETKKAEDDIEKQKLLDEKMKRAKELVEKQRKEKEAEEKEAEKERELRRRVDGQKLQDLKKTQEELELKQLKEDRKKEKQQEQEARRRILHQIEQDRLERAQRFGPAPSANPTPTTESAPKTSTSRPTDSTNNFARIQFKKPGGDIEMNTFNCSDTFAVLRAYVVDNILPSIGIRDFTLATTFPRREFTSADNETTLKDLGLTPTAVLLILPVTRSSTGSNVVSNTSRGVFDMAYSIIWNLFTPFFAVYGYLKNLIFNQQNPRENSGAEKRANEDSNISDNDAAKRRNMRLFESQPSTSGTTSHSPSVEENKGAYRRVGVSNIHRLHESRDSDDENNTWNGNSTQQQ